VTQVDKYCSIFVIYAVKKDRAIFVSICVTKWKALMYIIFNMSTKKNNSDIYQNFLQNELSKLMKNVPLEIRVNIYFQRDGAPAYASNFF